MSAYDVRGESGILPSRPTTLYLLLATLAVIICYVFYQFFLSPLRNVPGPYLARFTRLWELNSLRAGNFQRTQIAYHEKYGPVVRIAPNRYSITDPAAFKTIYGHGSKFIKSKFYYAFGHPDLTKLDLFSERDIASHALKRRRVSSLYSVTSLLSYEHFVDQNNLQLCSKLEQFAGTGRVFNVPTWMQYYAFDVIGSISVGKSFGYMEMETDPRGILSAIHESMVYGSRVGLFPELHAPLAFVASKAKLPIPFDRVGDFITEQINNRRSGKFTGVQGDFLDKLLDLKDAGKIEEWDIQTTIGANIAAGSDTTAITLSAILYFLIKHPEKAKKLHQEISEYATSGKISDPVTFQEGQKMPYLTAVIKEALRLHPATGMILSRIVPSGGAVLGDYFFPAGSEVGCNPWLINANENIYGSDPRVFRPERWLEASESNSAAMDTNLFSFGTGARTCIGKNISLLEVTKVIPQLFRKFEFVLENPNDEWGADCGWFVKQSFRCRVKVLASNM
ncbi:putative P450 monooxygenase [Hyaloscypha variabilis F]|uniref:Putative P450 monooxygenase n=1 Tax=Hyaloscypha variabilis (strain UAMH 11265 / GT02V1 / F) TaxID=1149755 RepID=A0A2J6S8X8_HYAVF|nr:putative P450 monooxygenase [Hyaloscypha variabilis F]